MSMMETAPTSLYMLRGEMFQRYVGDTFWIEGPKGALPIKLVQVEIGTAPLFHGTERRPFTLLFLGPPGVHNAHHLMLNLRHPKMGLIEGVSIGPCSGNVNPSWGHGQLWSSTFT
jgi:hypothetical protein